MQAITVKFLGPTNHRESRYKATCSAGSLTLGSDHRLNFEQNAARAAVALCRRNGWQGEAYGELICGGLEDGSYVFVMTGPTSERYRIRETAAAA